MDVSFKCQKGNYCLEIVVITVVNHYEVWAIKFSFTLPLLLYWVRSCRNFIDRKENLAAAGRWWLTAVNAKLQIIK